MNETKRNILIVVGVALISYGAGYFTGPSKVEEKIVYKESTDVKKEEKTDKTKIIYKEKITAKDGTVTEKETTEERNVKEDTSHAIASKEGSSEKITTKDIGLTVQALAIIDTTDLGRKEYGIYIKKRVLGNISVGAMATTDKKIALGLGLDF